MIEIASPATPQLGSLLPQVVRPRRLALAQICSRRPSSPSLPAKNPIPSSRKNTPSPCSILSKSALMVVPTPRQKTPATL